MIVAAALTAIATLGATSVAGAQSKETFHPRHNRVEHSNPHAGSGKVKNLIDHGGPVIAGSHLYAIWWGPTNDFPADEKTGMTSFLTNVGSSSYLQIAAQYMRGATLTASYSTSYTDTSAPTNKPSPTGLASEIQNVLNASNATADPNGVYFVFTSNLPKGASFCAWHTGATVNNVAIAEAYIPNVAGIAGCATGTIPSTNPYSAATQAVGDSTAHELMEAISDKAPGGSTTAWTDNGGEEMADKCEFKYSSPVSLGTTQWVIQEEWSNAVSGCVQQ
jgi:hypothetical protein